MREEVTGRGEGEVKVIRESLLEVRFGLMLE